MLLAAAVLAPAFASAALNATFASAALNATFVTVKSGKVQGYIDADHGNSRVFRGIPFAVPPVGDKRWRDPEPFGQWNGTWNASKFAAVCLQPKDGGWNTQEGKDHMSEDCLYLNVVAPPVAATAPATAAASIPVVVYLHAGEFHYGSASDRESDWPFGDDIILVTPNSRLGPFGFLASDDLRSRNKDTSTGSYGIADQRLALEWVQANIAAFGGNASNVIIMGESSGGTSVSAHLVSPASWGLFHKAILESPGLTQTKSMADAEVNYAYLTSALLSTKSEGCVRDGNKYAKFVDAAMERDTIGEGTWNYTKAAAECDANDQCVGFSLIEHAKKGLLPAYTKATLHRTAMMVGGGYIHLPSGENVTSYLKAAKGGDASVDCLTKAEASRLNDFGDLLPKGDTFFTDAFAPTLDGVAFTTDIITSLKKKQYPPKVSVLAGSNMDEGTIFMGLTPRLDCKADSNAFASWAHSFYGQTIGDKVVGAYKPANLRTPLPQCSRYAGPPAKVANAAADDAAAAEAEDEAAEEAAASASVGAPPPPGYGDYYMAAMRSAGDYAITCRVRQAAREMSSNGHAVYTYYFSHTPKFSANYQKVPSLGAFHGSEVPFVFGDGFELADADEITLSSAMGCYWRNFASTGDPNVAPSNAAPCKGAPSPLPKWPRFKGGKDEKTMVLDIGSKLQAEAGLKDAMCDVFGP